MNMNFNYNNNNHKYGKIVHISELEKEPKKYIGETVRVLGKYVISFFYFYFFFFFDNVKYFYLNEI